MILIRSGGLIDGCGGVLKEPAALLIDGDRILAAGPAAAIGVPDGAKVIEAPDRIAMPGLIDVHVHLAYSGNKDYRAFRAELAERSYASVALRAARYARDTLRHGYTSLRDMHAPGNTIIDLRNAINAGQVDGPRIKACGMGLTVTGGHMDQPGWGSHVQLRALTYPCDGADEFRAGVREQLKRGADFIKLNPCVSFRQDPDVKPYRFEMTIDEIRAACEEAHEQGVMVGAHTSGGPPLTAAVKAGCDTVEHAHWIDDETLGWMAEHGTYLVPTILVNETTSRMAAESPTMDKATKRWAELSEIAMWERLTRAKRIGVKVATGSDAGFMLAHGETNLGEMLRLHQGGYSAMEALMAATSVGADLMEIDAGRLMPGKLADILLVAGNPLDDLTILQDPENLRVFKDGREFIPMPA